MTNEELAAVVASISNQQHEITQMSLKFAEISRISTSELADSFRAMGDFIATQLGSKTGRGIFTRIAADIETEDAKKALNG